MNVDVVIWSYDLGSVNHDKSVPRTLLGGHGHPLGDLRGLTDLTSAPGLRQAVPHLSDNILKHNIRGKIRNHENYKSCH